MQLARTRLILKSQLYVSHKPPPPATLRNCILTLSLLMRFERFFQWTCTTSITSTKRLLVSVANTKRIMCAAKPNFFTHNVDWTGYGRSPISAVIRGNKNTGRQPVPQLGSGNIFMHSVRTHHVSHRGQQNRNIWKRMDKVIKPLFNSVSKTCICLNLGITLTWI
jgi:hypothetical protein